MLRGIRIACCVSLLSFAAAHAVAQSVTVHQTTPDLLEALSERATLHFSDNATLCVSYGAKVKTLAPRGFDIRSKVPAGSAKTGSI